MQDLLQKLRSATDNAKKEQETHRVQKRAEEKNLQLEDLKKKAKNLFKIHVTEEKLMSVAKNGLNHYPILFITDKHIVKNKKTGYRFNVGQLGQFLFEEIETNNLTPVIIGVDDYKLQDHMSTNPDWKRPFLKELVNKPGYYLGISW